jgi:hypothetical protein
LEGELLRGLERHRSRLLSLANASWTQENVDVVRAAYQAWNAGDMDAFRELLATTVIARTPQSFGALP